MRFLIAVFFTLGFSLQARSNCDLAIYDSSLLLDDPSIGATLVDVVNTELAKKGYRIGSVETRDILKADIGIQLLVGVPDGKIHGASGFLRNRNGIIQIEKTSFSRTLFRGFNSNAIHYYRKLSRDLMELAAPCGDVSL